MIPQFIGCNIQQIPPVFSALKKNGKVMYHEARNAQNPQSSSSTATALLELEKLESTMTPRTVEIYHLKLLLDDNDEMNHNNDTTNTNIILDDSKNDDLKRKKRVPIRLPHFKMEIECGGGTYIRSLIRDMGRHLHCCATMKSLVRTQQGVFHLEDAVLKEDWSPTTIYNAIEKCNNKKKSETCMKDN